MTLVYQARLGSAARKAVAAKLADHAQDDGTQVYPSLSRIAKETELSKSTVQRAIRDLRQSGILLVVEEGGSGRGATTKYRFDLAKLAAQPRSVGPADEGVVTDDGADVAANAKVVTEDNKVVTDDQKDGHHDHDNGSTGAAEEVVKVVTVPRKVVTVTSIGGHGDHRTIIESSEPSFLSELGSDDASQRVSKRKRHPYSEAFERFWQAYPDRSNNSKVEAWEAWGKMTPENREDATRSLPVFAAYCRQNPEYRCLHAVRYLRYRRWEAHLPAAAGPMAPAPWWRDRKKLAALTVGKWRDIITQHANGTWPVQQLGPPPGSPECVVPDEVMRELRLVDKFTPAGIRKVSHHHALNS